MAQLLHDGITSTAATKVPFTLSPRDFAAGSKPRIAARGLGTGDSIAIWEWIDDDWESVTTLTDADDERSKIINGPGKYAVTAVLATAGPVSTSLITMARS